MLLICVVFFFGNAHLAKAATEIRGDPKSQVIIAKNGEAIAVVVGPKSQFHSLEDLLTYARANPGALKVVNTSVKGGTSDLGLQWLALQDVKVQEVKFPSTAHGYVEVIRGTVDVVFRPITRSDASGYDGRAIATTGDQRDIDAPNVPTILELKTGITVPAPSPRKFTADLRLLPGYKQANSRSSSNDPKGQQSDIFEGVEKARRQTTCNHYAGVSGSVAEWARGLNDCK